ncbi:MAG: TIGR03915 family putative DNA repair protein [Gemmatimonadetes bacterium]|nr:TIGR03915 family putative DNA repair protein [Gemmatimonadota bacterium]
MRVVRFAATFDAWRTAARALLEQDVAPDSLLWEPEGDREPALDCFGDADAFSASGDDGVPAPSASSPQQARVPRRFIELAEAVACHAEGERWALLYRVLWRITHGEPHLLEVAMDPEVHRLLAMEKAVRRELHKMHAFVRFRVVETEDGSRYVAWFEPAHPVVERAAPFFAERFGSMRWSILTPLGCVHWDGDALAFTPGLPRSAAPTGDALEALWGTYYASTFNPARLRTAAMRAEMPVRYWRNLPEAAAIAGLVRDAPDRVRRMVEQAGLPSELQRPPRRSAAEDD